MSINIKRRTPPICPITITIHDNGKFADMAYFFDRYDVLPKIAEARNQWIGKELINNNDLDAYVNIYRDGYEWKKFWTNFENCRRIAKKCFVGDTYVRPILAAILSGVVTDADYKTIIRELPMENIPEELRLETPIAYISARIRNIDLKNIDKYKDTRSISNIKTAREWYWKYQEMGYRKLAKLFNKPLETVRSTVNSYEKQLRVSYRVV